MISSIPSIGSQIFDNVLLLSLSITQGAGPSSDAGYIFLFDHTGAQVFVTAIDPAAIVDSLHTPPSRMFHVEQGRVTVIE